MTAFPRFPHTPHLAWLGEGQPRNDKVLSAEEARELLSHELIIEEKIDGANLGIWLDASGKIHAQNRGTVLDIASAGGQFRPLKRWLDAHSQALAEALSPDLVLFGEWCHAVHSVRYTRLPDWFIAFDIYDLSSNRFWSAARRDVLVNRTGLSLVPMLGAGRYDLPRLRGLLERSRFADAPAEGLYLRQESGGLLTARAKLVRPAFTQAITRHWSKRQLETNSLSNDARQKGHW